ncbi:MAG: response regulator [Ktedonobacteraceae bacterium]
MSMLYRHKYAPTDTQDARSASKTILVVEDDADLGELIMQVLDLHSRGENASYHGVLVIDSMQALEMVNSINPDLFLLDYYLPRMDGLELYDRLHTSPGFEQVPAILISANPPRSEIEKRHLVSLKKPFNLRDLLHTIDRLLT